MDSLEEDASVVQVAAGLHIWVQNKYGREEIERMLEEKNMCLSKNKVVALEEESLKSKFFSVPLLPSFLYFFFF
jgi:hypothetical protein